MSSDADVDAVARRVEERLDGRLARMESKQDWTQREISKIGEWFGAGPESLPASVAALNKVTVSHEARLLELEGEGRKGLVAHIQGGWGFAVAMMTALGAMLLAWLKH